jgi:GTP-binding protein HflX
MLFATLDPTLRQVKLPNGRPAMLSDTVGFISDLPHELVEAFRATLEEVQEADIILHVRDIAGAESEAERADVEAVLEELEIGEDQMLIEVWNKADLLPAEAREEIEGEAARTGAALVSAVTGEGCDALLRRVGELIDDTPPLTLHLEAGQGEALAWLYRHARISDRREDQAGGCDVTVRMEPGALGRFERLFPQVGQPN